MHKNDSTLGLIIYMYMQEYLIFFTAFGLRVNLSKFILNPISANFKFIIIIVNYLAATLYLHSRFTEHF